jgi:phospholipid/cholesterol/gamma-HCH transport system ATP-binding protein
LIRCEGLTLRFGRNTVLDAVDFTVPTGRTLGLIGAGGAGKSCVLKVICGLMRPTAGRIWVDDDEVTALDETALMAVRGRIGMVFQNYALFDFLDVGDNIGFPLVQQARHTPEEITARVTRRLAQVSLPGIERRMPSDLSGGMKKRVCLARAIVHDPPIMLCDDPTAGLDPVTTNRIFLLLKQLQRENDATAIIVSHEVGYLRPICDEFLMLDHGKVIFRGTAAEGLAHADPQVRQFMSGEGVE